MSASEAFAMAAEAILDIETGRLVVDNNGAKTRWGINQAANPDVDVEGLDRAGARGLYHSRYWLAIRGPELSPSVAVQVFDSAVNQGVDGATRVLQLAAGVTADGIFGPVTLAAAQRLAVPLGLVELCSRRIQRYSEHRQWPQYRRTWLDRSLRFLLMSRLLAD